MASGDTKYFAMYAAAEKMKELHDTGGDAWGSVRETADRVWDELRTGLADAASKFKESKEAPSQDKPEA